MLKDKLHYLHCIILEVPDLLLHISLDLGEVLAFLLHGLQSVLPLSIDAFHLLLIVALHAIKVHPESVLLLQPLPITTQYLGILLDVAILIFKFPDFVTIHLLHSINFILDQPVLLND